MKKNYFITLVLSVLVVLGAMAVFATTLTHAVSNPKVDPEIPVPAKVAAELQSASSTLPVRLIIPSLKINARVQKVGISKHGTMAVPTNFTDVGWYKYGAIPGRVGNAVIAGHLDNALSLAGVFKHLSSLQYGDDVFVVDQAGNRLHFRVAQTATLDDTSTDTQTIFGQTPKARLVLITCEGTWQQSRKSYTERRIVYADLVQ